MNIYEITQELREALDTMQIDEETGEIYGERENVTNSLEQDVAEQRRLGYTSYGKYMAAKEAGAICEQWSKKYI